MIQSDYSIYFVLREALEDYSTFLCNSSIRPMYSQSNKIIGVPEKYLNFINKVTID